MGRLFGTDGVRGIANTELSCRLATKIAKAASIVIEDQLDRPPTIIVGMDTRISGGMLQAAINSGLCSVGAHSINIGVVPTPAIAYLVSSGYADAGIMISASHNPYEFNGIKIFGPDGNKLTDDEEFEIEAIVLDNAKPFPSCWKDDIGIISTDKSLVEKYIDHVVQAVEHRENFAAAKVVLDCSNGSASATAKTLFNKLGVEPTIINDEPNGVNINKNCGSTHMESLQKLVVEGGFDIGFAFDGDADRCLIVDEKGERISGDVVMAMLSVHLKKKGQLKDDTLVATVMSNMGLFKFAEEHGINIEITKVGDRYVLERMIEGGFSLGGEESGHVIQSRYMNTGDGQLTAMKVLEAFCHSGKKASELAKVMTVYPQVMKNFKADTTMKLLFTEDEVAQKIVKDVAKKLGKNGRILVRPSGTEPLIRVMIEGQKKEEIEKLVNQVVDQLRERLVLVQSYNPLPKEK